MLSEEIPDQRLALVVAERLEQDRRRVQLAAAPVGSDVEELRPRDTEQEDRRVAGQIRDVLDEVDEDRLGPLQVVDEHHLRPLRGSSFEEPPERELRLGRGRADDGVGLDPDRDQDLDEWPVRDPLAVREAAAAQNVRRVADALEEVGDEPRLADARRAEERERAGMSVPRRRPRSRARAAAARARVRREASPGGGRAPSDVGEHLEEANASTGSAFPFRGERLDRLDPNRVADEHPRLGSDEHRAGACRLLEPSRDVHRVSGDERLTLASDDDLARC